MSITNYNLNKNLERTASLKPKVSAGSASSAQNSSVGSTSSTGSASSASSTSVYKANFKFVEDKKKKVDKLDRDKCYYNDMQDVMKNIENDKLKDKFTDATVTAEEKNDEIQFIKDAQNKIKQEFQDKVYAEATDTCMLGNSMLDVMKNIENDKLKDKFTDATVTAEEKNDEIQFIKDEQNKINSTINELKQEFQETVNEEAVNTSTLQVPEDYTDELKDEFVTIHSMFEKISRMGNIPNNGNAMAAQMELLTGLNELKNSDVPLEKEFAELIEAVVDKISSSDKTETTQLVISKMFGMITANYNAKNTSGKYLLHKSTVITVNELMGMDKNADGSFIDELKAAMMNDKFIQTIQYDININETYKEIQKLQNEANKIYVDNIAKNFGKSEIADLFKTADGKVDRALIVALSMDVNNGSYTLPYQLTTFDVLALDVDNDGKITKDDLEKFKQSYQYQKAKYVVVMDEMERANDAKNPNRRDSKFCLADITKFMSDNTALSAEQKDLFSPITKLADKNLQSYIVKSITGSDTLTITQFTNAIDLDGDGIVTKEELQTYVDFAAKCYKAEKPYSRSKTDLVLTKAEAKTVEPFKSNPDLLTHFPSNNVKVSELWKYAKENNLL